MSADAMAILYFTPLIIGLFNAWLLWVSPKYCIIFRVEKLKHIWIVIAVSLVPGYNIIYAILYLVGMLTATHKYISARSPNHLK